MKNLKLWMITIIITTGFIAKTNAQVTGLYLTHQDFITHNLHYAADPKNSNSTQIYIHEFTGNNTVTVITNGKKEFFLKSEIFGYHDADNHDFRFYNGHTYQVLDTTGFYLYAHEKLVQQQKGMKPTKTFYFSKKANTRIEELNAENIAMAFPKNYKFKYMVEVEAKADVKLEAYDNSADAFKIKELYSESLK